MSFGASHALDASVLVLNKFFHGRSRDLGPPRVLPCSSKTWPRSSPWTTAATSPSISQSWREVSEARASFKQPDDEFIRTVHFEIQVPRVIRLLTYDRPPARRRSSSTGATSLRATAIAASTVASGLPPAS